MVTARRILLRMKNVTDGTYRENENIFKFNISSSENRTTYDIMWKNMVEQDRPQITIKYGVRALHAGYLRLKTHIQNM